MRFKLLAFIWFAALAAAPITLSADAGCCDEPAAACCDKPAMACCDQPATAGAPAAGCCQKGNMHRHDAAMACCKDGAKCDMPCCKDGNCDMPCCQEDPEITVNAIDVLLALDSGQVEVPLIQITPARQSAVVFFERPVWVGRTVLMGKYVIEHDTDRQARGEPCTHIYAFDDQKTPVAAFHCTHLEGKAADTAVVTVYSTPDGQRKLVSFQFAGETAAHGYPTDR
jgi:hypothetical protein